MTPKQFAEEAWGTAPPGQVLIWTLPDKRSTWFTNFKNLDSFCESKQNHEVYIGCGIAPKNHKGSANTRLTANQVAGIPGLWVDADVADKVHSRANLPPSTEMARKALYELPVAPTTIIHSGHGLQAWWFFDEPWIFADDSERRQAQSLSKWWQDQIAAKFAEYGWSLDATHDLSRVLRLPGTYNNKTEPIPVTVIDSGDTRWSVQEWIAMMPESPPIPSWQTVETDNLILDPSAEPPALKLATLIAEDVKFRKSWAHTRADLDDNTVSGYDLSLATLTHLAGWSDQEIANLLIAHRREWKAETRLREDYYQRTIAKAKDSTGSNQQELEELVAHDVEPEALTDKLSEMFKVKINQIVKYISDPPIYWMDTEKGSITLGKVETITNQSSFINAMAATCNVVIPKCKQPQWEVRAQAILNACTVEDLADISRPTEQIHTWLEEYLSVNDISEDEKDVDLPFVHNGQIYIHLNAFRTWLESSKGVKYTPQYIGQRLRQDHKTHAKIRRGKISIWAWAVSKQSL